MSRTGPRTPGADAGDGASTERVIAAAASLLRDADRIWLGAHVDPDGDAIGSLLGLAHVLRDLGKPVTSACADPPPREASFLPGAEGITDRPPRSGELAVALDAAEPSRLGRLFEPEVWPRLQTIVVDHHVSNVGFGTIDVIDASRASTAEIVLALVDAMGVTPTREAATCLLTGVVTDTLGFRTSSTTAETLDAGRRLMACGAPLSEITHQVFYRRPLAELLLLARVVERAEWQGSFLVATLGATDFAELGLTEEAARGITSTLATIEEPMGVALLRERDDGTIDLSMRSKPGIDLTPVARALGGGGHPQAAGARLAGPMASARAALAAALRTVFGQRAAPDERRRGRG